MKIGVNTWVWSSPLTTDEFARLAAHIAGMGFDLVEVPIENPGDFDYARAGAIARDHGLAVTRLRGDVAGSRPDPPRREHPRQRHGATSGTASRRPHAMGSTRRRRAALQRRRPHLAGHRRTSAPRTPTCSSAS